MNNWDGSTVVAKLNELKIMPGAVDLDMRVHEALDQLKRSRELLESCREQSYSLVRKNTELEAELENYKEFKALLIDTEPEGCCGGHCSR